MPAGLFTGDVDLNLHPAGISNAQNDDLVTTASTCPTSLKPKLFYKDVLREIVGPVKAVDNRKRKRKVERAQVLTSSPYKRQLEEKATASSGPKKAKVSKKDKGKKGSLRNKDMVPCALCGIKFCDDCSGQQWIQCQNIGCLKWYHNSCQGLEENYNENQFICIACESIDSD